MIQRRTFLRNLALASVAVAVRPSGLQAAASAVVRATSKPGEILTPAAFDALRGEEFVLEIAGGARRTLRLEHVAVYRREPHVENFSVHFRGATETGFTQGTRRLAHRELGEFDLFVVARPADAGTCTYEAVFNRLV